MTPVPNLRASGPEEGPEEAGDRGTAGGELMFHVQVPALPLPPGPPPPLSTLLLPPLPPLPPLPSLSPVSFPLPPAPLVAPSWGSHWTQPLCAGQPCARPRSLAVGLPEGSFLSNRLPGPQSQTECYPKDLCREGGSQGGLPGGGGTRMVFQGPQAEAEAAFQAAQGFLGAEASTVRSQRVWIYWCEYLWSLDTQIN